MADKENDSDEDVLELEGYKKSTPLVVLSWIGFFLTAGVLRLIFFWCPVWYLRATHERTTLSQAEKLLATDIFEKKRTQLICDVNNIDLDNLRKTLRRNSVYQEPNESHRFVDEQFESIFQDDTLVYFLDGTYTVLGDSLRTTVIKKLPYIWSDESHMFKRIAGVGPGLSHQDIHHYSQYSSQQREIMKLLYGENEITVPDTPYLVLVVRETFTFFYLLQFGNSILWGITGDWTYTGVMFVFTILIILLTSLQAKWNERILKRTVKTEIMQFKVLSGNSYQIITSDHIVPGDRIILPENGCRVPCDGIILSGTCIVNESILTGESVPLTKTPLPMVITDFIEKEASSHTMYMGTNMIRSQSSEPLMLFVTRTGFLTSQGSIVRSLLYPRPLDYYFENSVIKFALTLFTLSLIGAVINDFIQISKKESAGTIIINTIKISIMLIPAIMPILSASKLVGMGKIVKHKIYCINPAAFNLAGSVTCTCFDKTGTLTEDGLDLYSVVPSNSDALFLASVSGSEPPRAIEDYCISKAMASCHSIAVIDGQLTGDPIDVKMFEWTNWSLELIEQVDGRRYPTVTPKNFPNYTIQILHQNQFSSKLQRMSVVVKCSDEHQLRLYCKGSPETIISHSMPHSVPSDSVSVLESYTRRGFRVLGLATRVLDTDSIDTVRRTTRDELEVQMEFIGFIAFENKLKKETIPSIEELKRANYKIIMITGDNLQTAESVARESKIIDLDQTILELDEEDHQVKCTITKINRSPMVSSFSDVESGSHNENYVFSISGKAWKIIKDKYRHIVPKILVKSAVFARMSSDQKKEVIRELNAIGYKCLMCGDGANDCGALRVADVGISLSQTEASAAASFTSHVQDISCAVKVIRFGRCSLATSVCFFKYMIMASILMTIVERFMQGMNSNLTEGEIIHLNFVSNVNFAVWFPRSEPFMGPLPPHLPIANAVSFSPIFSMISNLIVYFCFQVGSFFLVRQFSWYTPPTDKVSYESYAMVCTVAFQIIILAVTQSPGYPFRKPVYTNRFLVVAILAVFILDIIITVSPTKTLINWLGIPVPPSLTFSFILLALLFCNFIICLLIERFIVDKIIYKRCQRYPYLIKTKTHQPFLEIQEQVKDYNWVFQSFQLSSYKQDS